MTHNVSWLFPAISHQLLWLMFLRYKWRECFAGRLVLGDVTISRRSPASCLSSARGLALVTQALAITLSPSTGRSSATPPTGILRSYRNLMLRDMVMLLSRQWRPGKGFMWSSVRFKAAVFLLSFYIWISWQNAPPIHCGKKDAPPRIVRRNGQKSLITPSLGKNSSTELV